MTRAREESTDQCTKMDGQGSEAKVMGNRARRVLLNLAALCRISAMDLVRCDVTMVSIAIVGCHAIASTLIQITRAVRGMQSVIGKVARFCRERSELPCFLGTGNYH